MIFCYHILPKIHASFYLSFAFGMPKGPHWGILFYSVLLYSIFKKIYLKSRMAFLSQLHLVISPNDEANLQRSTKSGLIRLEFFNHNLKIKRCVWCVSLRYVLETISNVTWKSPVSLYTTYMISSAYKNTHEKTNLDIKSRFVRLSNILLWEAGR